MLKQGDRAPAFSLVGDDGKQHSLAHYRGKWVVLYFYPKDMTPGCTLEACDFGEQHDGLSDMGAAVIGVSADALESHERFKSKYNLPFLLLSDPGHEVHQKYGAYGEKVLYGKKSVGTIRSTFLIDPHGEIAKIWKNVRVKGHVAAVQAQLQAAEAEGKEGHGYSATTKRAKKQK